MALGPQCQEILQPFLESRGTGHLFSPKEAEEARNAKRKLGRQTPMTPSQSKRIRKKGRARSWKDSYTVDSYRRAIERGCEKAGVDPAECWKRVRGDVDLSVKIREKTG